MTYDFQNFHNRSRLTEEQRYAILDLLEEDPHISMAEVARQLDIKYSSVRMGFEYLKGRDSHQKSIQSAEDLRIAQAVTPLMKQGKTFTEIRKLTGFSSNRIRSAARRLGRKDLMNPATIVPHGTASGYGYHGCRCLECITFNTNRSKRLYEDRKARAATDAPHGTETAYRNWGCRCRPCIDAGNKSNKEALTVPNLDKFRDHIVWTREEDEQIFDYSLTAKQLAVKLGRGVSAINLRRSGMWVGREPAAVVGS